MKRRSMKIISYYPPKQRWIGAVRKPKPEPSIPSCRPTLLFSHQLRPFKHRQQQRPLNVPTRVRPSSATIRAHPSNGTTRARLSTEKTRAHRLDRAIVAPAAVTGVRAVGHHAVEGLGLDRPLLHLQRARMIITTTCFGVQK